MISLCGPQHLFCLEANRFSRTGLSCSWPCAVSMCTRTGHLRLHRQQQRDGTQQRAPFRHPRLQATQPRGPGHQAHPYRCRRSEDPARHGQPHRELLRLAIQAHRQRRRRSRLRWRGPIKSKITLKEPTYRLHDFPEDTLTQEYARKVVTKEHVQNALT